MRSLPLGERLRSHVVCQEPVSWLGCQLGIKGGVRGRSQNPYYSEQLRIRAQIQTEAY